MTDGGFQEGPPPGAGLDMAALVPTYVAEPPELPGVYPPTLYGDIFELN